MKNNLNAFCGKNMDKKKFSQSVWMTKSVQMISLEDNITKGPFWAEKTEKLQSEIEGKGQESCAERESAPSGCIGECVQRLQVEKSWCDLEGQEGGKSAHEELRGEAWENR